MIHCYHVQLRMSGTASFLLFSLLSDVGIDLRPTVFQWGFVRTSLCVKSVSYLVYKSEFGCRILPLFMYVKCTMCVCVCVCVCVFTGNAAFLLVSNHFEIYPNDQVKVWHLFLRLSILGIAINFPFLIKNLVLLQFASNQNFGLHVQDCSVTKRAIFCTTAGIQNVIFPFLFWIFGSQM